MDFIFSERIILEILKWINNWGGCARYDLWFGQVNKRPFHRGRILASVKNKRLIKMMRSQNTEEIKMKEEENLCSRHRCSRQKKCGKEKTNTNCNNTHSHTCTRRTNFMTRTLCAESSKRRIVKIPKSLIFVNWECHEYARRRTKLLARPNTNIIMTRQSTSAVCFAVF